MKTDRFAITLKRLSIALSTITLDKEIWQTLQDYYELADYNRKMNNLTFDDEFPLEITSRVAVSWFRHLDEMAKDPSKQTLCKEIERFLKRTTISYIPLFFSSYHELKKMRSDRRAKMLVFQEFLMSYYNIKTEEAFNSFVDDVVKATYQQMVTDAYFIKKRKNKVNYSGLPVEDVDNFKTFFYNSDIGELNKSVPVYFDKEYLGDTEEFVKLPRCELMNYKIGTCHGFSIVESFDGSEVIISKFKPREKCTTFTSLREFHESEVKTNRFKLAKNQYLAKLVPIFETIEGKKVLKMMVFKITV